jgi:hypothetical protein
VAKRNRSENYSGISLPVQDRRILGLKIGKKPQNSIVSLVAFKPVLGAAPAGHAEIKQKRYSKVNVLSSDSVKKAEKKRKFQSTTNWKKSLTATWMLPAYEVNWTRRFSWQPAQRRTN